MINKISKTRLQASIEQCNSMSLEEIAAISNSHTQEAVLNRLTPERKAELALKAEELVIHYQNQTCGTGIAACPGNNFKTTDPYTNLKKYSHLYTVLSGWMTKEDMARHENEKWDRDMKELELAMQGGAC